MAVTGGGGRPARVNRWPAGLAWALWGLAVLSLGVNWWQDRLLRQAGRPDLAPLGAAIAAPVLAAVSARPRSGRCWPAAGPATRSAGCCSA
jgi:hypothetical protein